MNELIPDVKEVILIAAIKGKLQEYGYVSFEIEKIDFYDDEKWTVNKNCIAIKAWPIIRTYPDHRARRNPEFNARIPLRDKLPKILNMDFVRFKDERYYQSIILISKENP